MLVNPLTRQYLLTNEWSEEARKAALEARKGGGGGGSPEQAKPGMSLGAKIAASLGAAAGVAGAAVLGRKFGGRLVGKLAGKAKSVLAARKIAAIRSSEGAAATKRLIDAPAEKLLAGKSARAKAFIKGSKSAEIRGKSAKVEAKSRKMAFKAKDTIEKARASAAAGPGPGVSKTAKGNFQGERTRKLLKTLPEGERQAAAKQLGKETQRARNTRLDRMQSKARG